MSVKTHKKTNITTTKNHETLNFSSKYEKNKKKRVKACNSFRSRYQKKKLNLFTMMFLQKKSTLTS